VRPCQLAIFYADLRLMAHHIVFAQCFQTGIRSISHRHTDRILIHFELALAGKVQAALLGITKTVEPLAGV